MPRLDAPRTNDHGQPIGEPVPGWHPRPAPVPLTLTGRYVVLEPLTAGHAEQLFAALAGPQRDPLWTYRADGPPSDAEHLRTLLAALPADWVTFVIRPRGADAAGMASLLRIDPAHGSVEVGAIIYAPTLQRTRGATEAIALLAAHVFDDLGYRRFEWKCDSHNAPSRSAAVRLGFRYEGRFRNAMVSKGRNRDTDWFAMTDTDWRQLRPLLQRWLDPANFDAAGRQHVALSSLTAHIHS
jgi:RimJ/RimL family protein N-acetyltransferase